MKLVQVMLRGQRWRLRIFRQGEVCVADGQESGAHACLAYIDARFDVQSAPDEDAIMHEGRCSDGFVLD